jgi:hypothetical protein
MFVKATPKTPQIIFEAERAYLSLTGISCPDNPLLFYTPLFDELKAYLAEKQEITLEMQLDYFNTGSSKCLLTIFTILSEHIADKSNIHITWITDEGDNELMEAGKIFEEMSNLSFEFKTVE